MPSPQTYANHRRFFPLVHFFLLPLFLVNLVVAIVAAARDPRFATIWAAVVAVGLLFAIPAARLQALATQNRLIRLEERMRLSRLLPQDLKGAIDQLRVSQLIGIRFASDGEVPALVRRVIGGEVETTDAIKRAVKDWRGDTLRV